MKKKNINTEEGKKVFFIDTNVFICCIFGEKEKQSFDVIKKIESELKNKNFLLILPEIIKSEVLKQIELKFLKLESQIKNLNITDGSKMSDTINKSAKDAGLREIEENKKRILDDILKFFSNKNVVFVPLLDKDILSGLRRSALGLRPYRRKDELDSDGKKQNKPSFLKDCDCMAFESFLCYLKGFKSVDKCILCCDDGDYCTEKNGNILHPEIERDIKNICDKVSFFRSPLDMLEKEFGKRVTKKDRKYYKEIRNEFVHNGVYSTPLVFNDFNSVAPMYGQFYSSVINGLTENCPICGEKIKKYIQNYIYYNKDIRETETYALTSISSSLNRKKFECPYCKNQFIVLH